MLRNSNFARIAVISLLPILSACAPKAEKVNSVNLPPPPTCMEPVKVPLVTTGMDARLALAQNRSALLEANGRLTCSKDWYRSVRGQYAR